MVSNEGEGIIKYSGEILELNLSEWVLRNSSPAMGELTLASSSGIKYITIYHIISYIHTYIIYRKYKICIMNK